MNDTKRLTDFTQDELVAELLFVKKMKKFWYAREDEIMKEFERREDNGSNV